MRTIEHVFDSMAVPVATADKIVCQSVWPILRSSTDLT